MTHRARLFTGIATTTILAAIGLAMLTEGQKGPGLLVIVLALFRGYVLVRQAGLLDDEEEDDELESLASASPTDPAPPPDPPRPDPSPPGPEEP